MKGFECIGGKKHGEIITPAEHRDTYDPTVLGDNIPEGPWVHEGLYGYCADCHKGALWSVALQAWIDWPEGLHQLPILTGDEVEELLMAVKRERYHLESTTQQLPMEVKTITAKLAILRSLDTALSEARMSPTHPVVEP